MNIIRILAIVFFFSSLFYCGYTFAFHPEKFLGYRPIFFKKYTYEILYNRKHNKVYHRQLKIVGVAMMIAVVIGLMVFIIF